MADIKAIKELALYAAKKQVPTEFANKTVADVNEALRAELKELCGNYNLFRRNKLDLYFEKEIYQINGDKRFNALKYVHFYHRYQSLLRGDFRGEFLGL